MRTRIAYATAVDNEGRPLEVEVVGTPTEVKWILSAGRRAGDDWRDVTRGVLKDEDGRVISADFKTPAGSDVTVFTSQVAYCYAPGQVEP